MSSSIQTGWARTAATAETVEPSPWHASAWVRMFVIFQFACQVALLIDLFSSLRVYVRVAAFGASLLFLVVLPRGRAAIHPAFHAAAWVLVILCLSIFHPTTNSVTAGLAQIGLYLAILSPLFWVPRLQLDLAALRRVLLIIFIFHSVSAGIGVLQVYFPGSFQPNLSSIYAAMSKDYIEDLKITLASGQRVFRPMGLTDIPGGAASAGFYAVLLGLGFYLTSRRREFRLICLGCMTMGMICLYLSQVRSLLVLTAICLLAFCILLAWQKRENKLFSLLGVLAFIIILSFTIAVSVGGESITNRMFTLVQDRPDNVYYQNRGVFLERTVKELIPQYPFGAGLGRWGMMNVYFGDNSDPERSSIWAEIQWAGWVLDGGVPLIFAYVIAIFITLYAAWKVAMNPNLGELSLWGAVVLAYSLGAFAVTFNYPTFASQAGMEFWLLNATLFAAARKKMLSRPASLRRPQR